MAEVSRTTNLDKFQTQFDKVGDKHEARIEKRNGEAFVVKGRGKSKLGRLWFACKYLVKPKKALHIQNRNVVKALKESAKRDYGSMGPKLVSRYLKEHGKKETDALSKQDVKAVVSSVKDAIKTEAVDLARKYKGLDLQTWSQIRGDQTLRNMLEDFSHKDHNPENFYFMEDGDRTLRILNGDADPSLKQAAFELFAKRYVGGNSRMQANLGYRNETAFKKILDDKKPFTSQKLQKMKEAIKNGRKEIWGMMVQDSNKRFTTNLNKGDLAEPRFKQPISEKRDHYQFDSMDAEFVKTTLKVEHLTVAKAQELAKSRPKVKVGKDEIVVIQPKKKKRKYGRVKKGAVRQDDNVQVRKKEDIKVEPKNVKKKEVKKIAPKKAPKKAPDPHAKVKKFLNKTPGVKNHPQLKNLTSAEFKEINTLFADKKELLAINRAKEILANKA